MSTQKFTFKIYRPQGRYKSFYNSNIDIKLKGQKVGSIHERLNKHYDAIIAKYNLRKEERVITVKTN